MAETLIERVRRIENPDHISTDKDAEMRKTFEEYAENTVVRAVRDGRTTFSQEYQNALGSYDSWRAFVPNFPPGGIEQNIADLDAAIGGAPVDSRWQSKLENPLGMATMFGIVGAAVSVAASRPAQLEEISKRDFLIGTSLYLAMFGGAGGFVHSYQTKAELDRLNQNAKHLDEVYNRLYPSTIAQKEPLILDRRGLFNMLYQRA